MYLERIFRVSCTIAALPKEPLLNRFSRKWRYVVLLSRIVGILLAP